LKNKRTRASRIKRNLLTRIPLGQEKSNEGWPRDQLQSLGGNRNAEKRGLPASEIKHNPGREIYLLRKEKARERVEKKAEKDKTKRRNLLSRNSR